MSNRTRGIITVIFIILLLPIGFYFSFNVLYNILDYKSEVLKWLVIILCANILPAFPLSIMRVFGKLVAPNKGFLSFLSYTSPRGAVDYMDNIRFINIFNWVVSYITCIIFLPLLFIQSIIAIIQNNPY